ncbi:unnamed protein product, partial [Linum tenue]
TTVCVLSGLTYPHSLHQVRFWSALGPAFCDYDFHGLLTFQFGEEPLLYWRRTPSILVLNKEWKSLFQPSNLFQGRAIIAYCRVLRCDLFPLPLINRAKSNLYIVLQSRL